MRIYMFNITEVNIFCDIKFKDGPTHKIQEIKCPTNKKDFTVNLQLLYVEGYLV